MINKKKIIILFFLAAVFVFFWLNFSRRSFKSPKETVTSFYNFWLSYSKETGDNPISARAYQEHPKLTDSLISRLDVLIGSFEERGSYDPILCAQDFPLNMDFVEADQTEDSASVVVEQNFYGNSRFIIVSLKKIEEKWKIDSINCPLEEINYTEEQSKQIAENWIIEKAPTYVFDGTDLNLKEVLALDLVGCENCYQLIYQFNSRHSGYGERDGQILAQVITPHSLMVTIENGKITQAITDEVYDELHQVEVE